MQRIRLEQKERSTRLGYFGFGFFVLVQIQNAHNLQYVHVQFRMHLRKLYICLPFHEIR